MKLHALLALGILASVIGHAQLLPREQWGAPLVDVSHANGQWVITGKKNRVTLNESSGAAESDGAAVRVQFKLPPTARDGTLQFEVPASGTDAANFEFGKSAPKS